KARVVAAHVVRERFRDIVLRLFHTELETAYEEFNMYQDMDNQRARAALMAAVFPTHPYGRPVIGLPEHLKNPSMVNINAFARTYYVPNNMAIALSGDLDFEATIRLIDRYFGTMPSRELPPRTQAVEAPLQGPIIREVTGREAENMQLAFRFAGEGSDDQAIVTLIDMILSNSQAGLIDLNLNQQQKVLKANSYAYFLKDYGMHVFSGNPREGQKLEEVRDLLLAELEKVKRGEFPDWLPSAIINDMRLSDIRRQESNFARVNMFMGSFTRFRPYAEQLGFIDRMEKITKQDIMTFARERYGDNYVVVYKRRGDPDNLVKVQKPPITAIDINREGQSEFFGKLTAIPSGKLEPVFVDFNQAIQKTTLKEGAVLSHIRNTTNALFNLQYILDMGSNHDRLLPLAVEYLPYLGTDRYTAAELQQEMFKLGISLSVNSGEDRCYISISGLERSLEEGIKLLEHILSSVKPDPQAYQDYVAGILKQRGDDKLDKNAILWKALFNYGKYGPESPVTNILSEEELKALDPALLTGMLKGLTSFQHQIFYYGERSLSEVSQLLSRHHALPERLTAYPEARHFPYRQKEGSEVLFVDYDMVQASIILMAQGPSFNPSLVPASRLFGEYYGSGLSSIVFQEIRESRALAYSAFSAFSEPRKKEDPFYLYGFVGTQGDKLPIATEALLGLMNEMPKATLQFDQARESIIKRIETERIIKSQIFWTAQRMKDLGLDYDIRRDVYQQMQSTNLEGFSAFFREQIAGKHYTYLVMGKRDKLDFGALGKLGTVKEVSLPEIFGY
ncbi:MAG TPA: insulinase family protein, partial [Bacteroidales bacterium]|nr:insulinase family protein [Bacteroidales bacterium]